MFTAMVFTLAFPFFGVTLIVIVHLPGKMPTTFETDTLHIFFEVRDTVADTFAPFGTENCAALASINNDCAVPVFTATVRTIASIEGLFVSMTGDAGGKDEKSTANLRVKVFPIVRTPLAVTDGLRVNCTRKMHRPTLVGMTFPSTI